VPLFTIPGKLRQRGPAGERKTLGRREAPWNFASSQLKTNLNSKAFSPPIGTARFSFAPMRDEPALCTAGNPSRAPTSARFGSTGALVCQPPVAQHRDLLCSWRLAYDVEVLGATDSPEQRERAAGFLDWQIAEGNAWIAMDRGAPISLSGFNATLAEMVQLGDVYTPPNLRGRGFAKVAVAGSLLAARDRGASRAVLFTNNPSAVRSYEALGFEQVGDFSLVLLQ
jgi:GNAT superfamily N-acetyltransferase